MNQGYRGRIKKPVLVGGLGISVMLALGTGMASAAPKPSPKVTTAPINCPAEEGVTPTSITLGFFSPKTGPAAANFAGGEEAAKLRIAQENAKGGIFGRKIQMIGYDDMASAATQVTVANKAMTNDHVFGIVMTSANDAAFPTFKAANLPVTGFNVLAMATDKNTFSVTGPSAPGVIATHVFERLKATGASKIALIAHNTPGAATGMTNTSKANQVINAMTQSLLIIDEPQGAHDATSTALRVKQSGADAAYMSMYVDGVVSIAQALSQQGVPLKGVVGAGVIDPAVIAKVAGPLEGMIGTTYGTIPVGVPGHPAMRTFVNGMKAAGLNPYSATPPIAYAAADLMIEGLKRAGKCLTRASFVDNLRKVTSFDAHGLIPQKVSFQPGVTPMGSPNNCSWYIQIKNGVPVPDKAPTCGKLVNTTTMAVVG